MPKINAERLLADLDHLRTIGGVETGVVRTALSEKDMEARRWLKRRFEEAGLETTVDGVGNVFGRTSKPGPVLLIGSHSDTQPRGGWLDGALGVIYGLEIARCLAEDPETADLAVDVVSWQDEEGLVPRVSRQPLLGRGARPRGGEGGRRPGRHQADRRHRRRGPH
ncbi:MAG: M28 family peptidase [Thalassobaculum sp.]